MHSEEQYARRAFKAGAAGYISKDSRRTELVEAVNKVIEGGRYVSPAVTISTYRARILEKMSMKTNAELTHYAIQNKLVD